MNDKSRPAGEQGSRIGITNILAIIVLAICRTKYIPWEPMVAMPPRTDFPAKSLLR